MFRFISLVLFAPDPDPAAGGGGSAPAPAAAPTVVTPPPATSDVPTEKGSDQSWLTPRIEQAKRSAQSELLKGLGFATEAEAKAAVEAGRKAQEATLTEQERTSKRLQELEPLAPKVTSLEATVKAYADKELAGLSDLQRGAVTALAGEDPSKVLETIEKLRPTWGTAAPAETPKVAGAPAATPPASTSAAPKAPTGVDGVESPVDHKAAYSALVKTNPFQAARYYEQHSKAITT